MSESFQCVGTVEKVRESGRHVVAEVPGKIALVLFDEHVGGALAYFPRERRPKIGARVGVQGTWVQVEVPLSMLDAEELEDLCSGGDEPVGTPLQCQVDVRAWRAVSDDYDPYMF